MIRILRATALGLAMIVFAWQGWNAVQGHFVHRFLVADIVASLVLVTGGVWHQRRVSAVLMLVGFSALGAIFLTATTAGLLVDGYRATGTALTTIGLVPCATGVVLLGRRICSGEFDSATNQR